MYFWFLQIFFLQFLASLVEVDLEYQLIIIRVVQSGYKQETGSLLSYLSFFRSFPDFLGSWGTNWGYFFFPLINLASFSSYFIKIFHHQLTRAPEGKPALICSNTTGAGAVFGLLTSTMSLLWKMQCTGFFFFFFSASWRLIKTLEKTYIITISSENRGMLIFKRIHFTCSSYSNSMISRIRNKLFSINSNIRMTIT